MNVSGGTLKFKALQTIGAITTSASADMQGAVTNYYSFGGSGNFGDITASFSKSKMYQTERLFGQIEYLSGNTKASAQLTQVTSPNVNYTAMASMFSLLDKRDGFLDKYLQVGAGSVTGTANGQSFNETIGTIRVKMPVIPLHWWSDKYIDVSSNWHNGVTWGGPPVLNSSPMDMNLDTLFISHDNYKSSIFGHVNQFTLGLGWTY